jgi:hypothetical protein
MGERFCINAKVIVYAALSGMISFLPDGTIYGCNHHFAVMLFGYSQEELLKKVRVVTLLPFCLVKVVIRFLSVLVKVIKASCVCLVWYKCMQSNY